MKYRNLKTYGCILIGSVIGNYLALLTGSSINAFIAATILIDGLIFGAFVWHYGATGGLK